MKKETIKLRGQIYTFVQFKTDEATYFDEQIESLIRRQCKEVENYSLFMAGTVGIGIWSTDAFGYIELYIGYYHEMLTGLEADVTIGTDGTIHFFCSSPEGQHDMNLYLLDCEEYEMNPYKMEEFFRDKEPLKVDAEYLQANGIPEDYYSVITKTKEGE